MRVLLDSVTRSGFRPDVVVMHRRYHANVTYGEALDLLDVPAVSELPEQPGEAGNTGQGRLLLRSGSGIWCASTGRTRLPYVVNQHTGV